MTETSKPKRSVSWTRAETSYLRRHYMTHTAKEIAEALGKTVPAIYNRAQALRLTSRRAWSQKEKDYVSDALGRLTVRDIATQILRTPGAVREYMKRAKIKTSVSEDDVTLKSLAATTGISEFCLYSSVKSGELPTLGRQVNGSRAYCFDVYESVRPWVLKRFPHRSFTCFECGEPVVGDIVCAKHASYMELPPKPSLPTQFVIPVDDSYRTNLRNTLLSIRQQAGMDQESVSTKAGYNPMWWGAIERGKPIVTAEDLSTGAEAMGWDVEIVFRKRKETQHGR